MGRKGIESKYMRFGFIADELESVLPQLVRSVGNQQVVDQKAVVYQDLIALLAAAGQSQQHRIETLEVALEELRSQLHSQLQSVEEAKGWQDSEKELREELKALKERLK